MTSLLAGLALYTLPCAAALLCGRGLLRLMRVNLDLPRTLLLAPAAGLLFWTLALLFAGAAGARMRDAVPWVWGVTLVVASAGVYGLAPALRRTWPWLALCMALPVAVLLPQFLQGLGSCMVGIAPDGWAYIAGGQYLWEYPRGTTGGLAPLHQFAVHLSQTRQTSMSLLGFFSPLVSAGDTHTVVALLQAWTLFVLSSSLAFFWTGWPGGRAVPPAAVTLTILSGWIANLTWAHNLDNGLALVYAPACAGLLRGSAPGDLRRAALLGLLGTAAFLTYPELAPVTAGVAGILFVARCVEEPGERRNWRRAALTAMVVAGVLLAPFAPVIIEFGVSQFLLTQTAVERPGESFFPGLLDRRFLPGALWGLGGEHLISAGRLVRNVVGLGLAALALLGFAVLWRDRRRALALAFALPLPGIAYLLLHDGYAYGAYKLLVMGWWGLVGAAVLGADAALRRARGPHGRTVATAIAASLAAVLPAQSRHATPQNTERYIRSDHGMLPPADFSAALRAAESAGPGQPLVVWVDDWLANQWAVYHLRRHPIHLAARRMYMAAPARARDMDQSHRVDLGTARFLLTDVGAFAEEAARAGWRRRWTAGPYAFWEAPASGAWSLLLRVVNQNGMERADGVPFFWLGAGATTVEVLANRAGSLQLAADFLPGPSVPGQPCRALEVRAPGHREVLSICAGPLTLSVPVLSGSTRIDLCPVDRATAVVPGDSRPLILAVRDLRLRLSERRNPD